MLWKASVCCKAYLLPLMLYHYEGLNHICLSPDYHCCTISTEPKSTSESLGPQKNLLEEKRWETSHLLDLCWKLWTVYIIWGKWLWYYNPYVYSQNAVGKDTYAIFCKIILLGSKVVAMDLCLQGGLIGVDLASESMIQALWINDTPVWMLLWVQEN